MKKIISRKKFWFLFIGISIIILFTGGLATSQEIPDQQKEKVERAKLERAALEPQLKKISSGIYDILKKMEAVGITRENAKQQNVKNSFSTPLLDIDDNGRLRITLRTTEITPTLLSQLAELEFEVVSSTADLNITPNHQMISGWAPFDKIGDIARLTPIFHIRPTDKPIVQAGDAITEGDAILRADLARSTFGVSGFGQKVGVISDGCYHRINSQASGDLPPNVQVINNRFGGDEGTAMMEIVYDLAPRVDLAFADFGNDQADFANNIMLLKDAGCTIITDDIIYLAEPVYEDGIIAQTVDNVVNNHNIVYTSSAGNQQLNHYEGNFSDNDNDNWHNFASNDEGMTTQLLGGATIIVILQWNNKFGKSGDDYDLYIYNEQLTTSLASSSNFQNGDDDPVEAVGYTNPNSYTINVNVVVKKYTGQVRNLSIYVYGGAIPLQYNNLDGTVFGHAGAQRCLAVGAIDAHDPGNDNIESFSSHGPTRIYSYDATGNPISFVNRDKPEHSAIDGVQTKTGQLGFFPNPFFGTSAATPHTAGVAALIREATPTLTAIDVGNTINNTAVDLGPAGFDLAFGHGRIDAYAAVSSVITGTPDITVAPPSFEEFLPGGGSVTRIMTIGNVGDRNLNFGLVWNPTSFLIRSSYPDNTKVISPGKNTELQQQLSSDNQESITPLDAKSAPLRSWQPIIKPTITNAQVILLQEGFEGGVMPPTGWTRINGPSSPGSEAAHWRIDNSGYVYSGTYGAACPWGYNLNEWLISPALDLSAISNPAVSFQWASSYYWHVSPNDNGDLFVKVSVDGGTTWNPVWTFGNIGVWQNWVWYFTTIDLSAYQGQPNVKIAFNVVANDNADIALDDIMVYGEVIEYSWVVLNPPSGSVPQNGSQNIDVLITTILGPDILADGDYFGNILITSNDPDEMHIAVPVTLHVGGVQSWINVTYPNGGENWFVNIPQTIAWTSNNVPGDVKIEISLDNGASWSVIAPSIPNTGSFPWTPTTAYISDLCLIKITSISNSSIFDGSNAVFSIKPSAQVQLWINDDLVGPSGGTINIPVNISDVTNLGVFSADMIINYNPNVLTATGVTNAGTIAAGWGAPTAQITPGQISIAMAGSSPLTGQGILIFIIFNIIGTEGSTSPLHFARANLNEGIPTVSADDGSFRVSSNADIKGRLGYYSNPAIAVNNATVQLTGNANQSYVSNVNGNYEFLDLASGNYLVTPTKTNDTRNSITSYDASFILRYAVGALTLTPYQKIAADVSGNGDVTSYDASFILRYNVGLITQFPIGADWTFVPLDFPIDDTNWSTSPRSRAYTPLQSDQLNQDYAGILYGDVSGNWVTSGAIASSGTIEFSMKPSQKTNEGKMLVPIEMKFTNAVYSGGFKLLFNNTNLKYASYSVDNSAPANFLVATDGSAKEVNVGFASAYPLDNQNIKINFLFEEINSEQSSRFEFEITDVTVDDNPSIATVITNDYGKEIPTDWSLSQNHPNPFNSETQIWYEVPFSSQVTIEVFNLLGQRMQTLVNEVKKVGKYQIQWNGLDDQGHSVGSGIYIYRMQAGNFVSMKKMILVQ